MGDRKECLPPSGTIEGSRCILRAPRLPVWKGLTDRSEWVWRGGRWESARHGTTMSPEFAALALYEYVMAIGR